MHCELIKRRNFLISMGASAALLPSHRVWAAADDSASAEELQRAWTSANDGAIRRLITRQNRREGHAFRGGFPNKHGIHFIGSAASATKVLAAGYLSRHSEFYQSPNVADAMVEAADFLLRVQHPDGTIDLLSTNFYSPPDTAFAVEWVALTLSTIKLIAPDAIPVFQERAASFLQRAGEALITGGVHTPNHRWVVCMALARINSLFPRKEYLERINRWLLEGIDIDSDGQYTERSVAGYTPLVNRCLITISRLLQRPKLLEPVRRNLEMTLFFVHPNGDLVTEASRRQDQYRISKAHQYYYSYRYLAIADGDGRFSAMTRLIEQTAGLRSLSNNLIRFMEDPLLNQNLPAPKLLPTRYVKSFPESNLVRIRRDNVDATILSQNDTFFTFSKGNAVLQAVRLATAFFGRGQFVSRCVRAEDGCFVLEHVQSASYYQPFPQEIISGDGTWESMPRSARTATGTRQLTSIVTVKEDNGRFTLSFNVSGTENVPLAIELAFRRNGVLTGVDPVDRIPDAYALKEGYGQYRCDDQTIEFGPGHADHSWTALRGAKPKLDAKCVYLTGFTPFQFDLQIH